MSKNSQGDQEHLKEKYSGWRILGRASFSAVLNGALGFICLNLPVLIPFMTGTAAGYFAFKKLKLSFANIWNNKQSSRWEKIKKTLPGAIMVLASATAGILVGRSVSHLITNISSGYEWLISKMPKIFGIRDTLSGVGSGIFLSTEIHVPLAIAGMTFLGKCFSLVKKNNRFLRDQELERSISARVLQTQAQSQSQSQSQSQQLNTQNREVLNNKKIASVVIDVRKELEVIQSAQSLPTENNGPGQKKKQIDKSKHRKSETIKSVSRLY